MLKAAMLIFLVACGTVAHAQSSKVTGLVTAANERQSDVSIKNISRHTLAISNERGEFVIAAKPGDTLVAVKGNYLPDTVTAGTYPYLVIRLKSHAILLKEVQINGTAISPEATYAENKKEYKEIYVRGDKSRMVSLGSIEAMGLGININIDKLYNALSKQGKDARALQRNFTKDYQNSVVDQRFNPLAARYTGYSGKRLTDFIGDNRPTYEMVTKSTDYDLMRYIKKKMAARKEK